MAGARNKLHQQSTTTRTGTQMGSRYQATSNKLLSQGARPNTTVGVQQDLDIFEDEEEEGQPGPGAYFNPKTQSSFKTGKVPERLQFFGSTVDRFSE